MPHKDKKSTLIRQWEMMRLLPSTYWMRASEMVTRLKEAGHDVTLRTVQRDLHELSLIFPIRLNRKNPKEYGWKWMKDAHLEIPGMSLPEALALRMVEMHLKQMLPSGMLNSLQGVFGHAKTVIEKDAIRSERSPKEWLKKVKVVQPNQSLLPPQIDEAAQEAIYNALLKNRRISATYRPIGKEEFREYELNPLGLIMRGPVSYLVATAWDYENPLLYAMHRFGKAELLEEEARIPQGFDLEKQISSGFADFSEGGANLVLEILCQDAKASYLAETPLSSDQTLEPYSEGWKKLTATVNDTWQLRWWLLSQGSEIIVLSPQEIRSRIAEDLKLAGSYYESES